MQGMITTIQRMSIHDGPGIRSTVFLKGCNLRCRWCHNPETWHGRRQLNHVAAKCAACGRCVRACTSGALSIEDGRLAICRSRCTPDENCACAGVCPNDAISVIGKSMNAGEVVRSLLQDKPFFEESGGGVTLSGGEPMMQADFLIELLQACREAGLHTAVESNLAAPWETVEQLLPYVDLWMCDLKVADPDIHKQWTGVSNARVLDNLRRLTGRGVAPIVRTPVILGVNDTPGAIEAICALLDQPERIRYYELLAFHALGFDKFCQLGEANPMPDAAGLDAALFEELKKIPPRYGLKTKQQYDGSTHL